jgi:hypothetical protein
MEKGVTKFSRRQAPWHNRQTTLATAMLAAPILFGPACMLGSAFWILVTVPRQYSTWQEMKLIGNSIIDLLRSSTPAKFRWLNIVDQATGSTRTDTQRVDCSKPCDVVFLAYNFWSQKASNIIKYFARRIPEIVRNKPYITSNPPRTSCNKTSIPADHYQIQRLQPLLFGIHRIWTNIPMKKIVLSK